MMDADSFYADVRFWLYLLAWVPWTAFAVLYATRSPWYVSWLGRALLLAGSVLAVLLTHTLIVLVFGPGYPGEWAVRVFLVGGVILAGWILLMNLIKEQRAGRLAPPCPRRRATDR